jgi:hypothetical protein
VRKLRRDAGLSMLEVLVTVSVIGLALAPLVVIQGQIAQTHRRYEAAYQNSTLQRNALTLLQDLNPMAQKEGEIVLDTQNRLHWQATALTRVDRSTGYPLGDGAYDVALYSIEARIVGSDNRVRVRFSTERVGWQRIDDVESTDRFGAAGPDPSDPSTPWIGPPVNR